MSQNAEHAIFTEEEVYAKLEAQAMLIQGIC